MKVLTRRRCLSMALVGLAGVVLAGCGLFAGDPPAPLPVNAAAKPQLLEDSHKQEVEWIACEENRRFQCADVTVPLNYADPGGDTTTISVNRLRTPARKANRLGSLVIGPQAPGESGRSYLLENHAKLVSLGQRYDLVGFDARGTSRTNQARCPGDAGLDRLYQTDFTPETEAEKAKALDSLRSYAGSCGSAEDETLTHLGTENVSRDLDVLRAVVHDKKLNYFGVGYGTVIGQRYAAQFPKSVGRMVWDSVEDPDGGAARGAQGSSAHVQRVQEAASEATRQDVEFETSLRRIFQRCVDAPDQPCPIGGTPKEAMRSYDTLLARLDQKPLPNWDGRRLTDTLALVAAQAAAFDPDSLGTVLTRGIAEASQGQPRFLMSLADVRLRRGIDGEYDGGVAGEYLSSCLVGEPSRQKPGAEPTPTPTVRMQSLVTAVDRMADEAAARSQHFGELSVYLSQACTFWPVGPTAPAEAIVSNTKAPILVVNAAGDPAAPLAGVRNVVERFPSSVLLTSSQAGHGAFARGNKCVDAAVREFLLTGKAPQATSCKS